MNQPAPHDPSRGCAASGQRGEAPVDVVPWGHRPGIITANTVFPAFSLAFLRYWGFEAPGAWRWYSVFPICLMAASVLLQLIAPFRVLRLKDVRPAVHRVTVRWFVVAVSVMVAGVLLAAFEVTLA